MEGLVDQFVKGRTNLKGQEGSTVLVGKTDKKLY